MVSESRGISQLLAELTSLQVLLYALQAAEAVRRIHDAGHVHGAISPAAIVVVGSAVQLLAAAPCDAVTPYTAPEVLQGRAADVRSDIFAFGAVLYELLTGRHPFEGADSESLAAAIATSVPPPSGLARADYLIAKCLAKDPCTRWQRMRLVVTELRLLIVAERVEEWHQAGSPHRPEGAAGLRALRAAIDKGVERIASSGSMLEQRLAVLDGSVRCCAATLGEIKSRLDEQTDALRSLRRRQEERATALEMIFEGAQSGDPGAAPVLTAPGATAYWFPGRRGRGWPASLEK